MELFSAFGEYKDTARMKEYNIAYKKKAITFDSAAFSEKLLQELLKRSNFSLRVNSEVNGLNYNTETGVVESVRILGKSGKDVKCDALVLCTGGSTSRILYQTIGAFSPLLPVKGITFDYRTEAAHLGKHLVFEDTKLLLTQIEDGLWRVSAYGDIAGMGEEFD